MTPSGINAWAFVDAVALFPFFLFEKITMIASTKTVGSVPIALIFALAAPQA